MLHSQVVSISRTCNTKFAETRNRRRKKAMPRKLLDRVWNVQPCPGRDSTALTTPNRSKRVYSTSMNHDRKHQLSHTAVAQGQHQQSTSVAIGDMDPARHSLALCERKGEVPDGRPSRKPYTKEMSIIADQIRKQLQPCILRKCGDVAAKDRVSQIRDRIIGQRCSRIASFPTVLLTSSSCDNWLSYYC